MSDLLEQLAALMRGANGGGTGQDPQMGGGAPDMGGAPQQGGILGMLQKLSNAASPGSQPTSNPALEQALGPEVAAQARAAAQRSYAAARAQAVRQGARWWEMDALAAPAAQSAYQQNLMQAAQTMDYLQNRRDSSDRRTGLQKVIAGIADPQQAALAQADPSQYMAAAIKKEFTPDSENFSSTATGAGSIAVTDKRSGKTTFISDPNAAAAFKAGMVKEVDQGGTKVLVDVRDGSVIYRGEVTDKPGADAKEDRQTRQAQNQMRRQFEGLPEVKNYISVLPRLKSAEHAPDTAAGDLDLIYAVGSILDPGSVVREGEMTMVVKSGSLMNQLLGTTRVNLGGKARFDPTRRKQLTDMLNNRVSEMQTLYKRSYDQYGSYASDEGWEPFKITGSNVSDAYNDELSKFVK